MATDEGLPVKRFAIGREPDDEGGDMVIRRLADGKVIVRVERHALPRDETQALLELRRRLAIALEDERRHAVRSGCEDNQPTD